MGAGEDFELDDEFRSFVEERLGVPFDQDEGNGDDEEEVVEEGEESPEPVEEPEPVSEPEGEPETAPEPPQQPSESNMVDLGGGVSVPREVAFSYAQFDAILRNDPELFRLINETVQGRAAGAGGAATSPTSSPAPALPQLDDDDLSDPALKALYDTARAQQSHIADLNARLKQVSDVTIARENEEFQSLLGTIRASFAKTHDLTRDQMDQVQATAERLNVVPSLMRGIDPITGTQSPRDRTTAITRAFDIAYNYIPQFRERAVEEAVRERAKSTRRKQKLAGISGSGGGMSKSEPVPTNERERREAMIREVAEAMGEHRPE